MISILMTAFGDGSPAKAVERRREIPGKPSLDDTMKSAWGLRSCWLSRTMNSASSRWRAAAT